MEREILTCSLLFGMQLVILTDGNNYAIPRRI